MNPSTSSDLSKAFSSPVAILTLGGLFALNAVSIDGPIVAIPAIADDFHVANGQAQLVTSLFLLGYALSHIPVGLLGDRFGRRPVILTGLLCGATLSVAACFAQSLDVLMIIRFLQGMVIACGGLLSRAMIRDIANGKEAAKLMSSALSVLTALIIIIPLLSGFVLEVLGWRYVLALVSIYTLLLTLMTFILIPETSDAGIELDSLGRQLIISIVEFFSSKQSIIATLLGSIVFATYFILATIGASVIKDQFNMPGGVFGILFSVSAAVQFCMAMLNSRFVPIWGIRKMLVIASWLSVAGVLSCLAIYVFGGFSIVTFGVIGCLFSMSHGLTLPNTIALTLDPLPKRAGFAASINGMVQTGLASVISFIVSSFYTGTADFVLMFFGLFGVINLMVFSLYFSMFRKL